MKKSNFIFAIKPVNYLSRWLKLYIIDSKIISLGIALCTMFFLAPLLGGVGGGFYWKGRYLNPPLAPPWRGMMAVQSSAISYYNSLASSLMVFMMSSSMLGAQGPCTP